MNIVAPQSLLRFFCFIISKAVLSISVFLLRKFLPSRPLFFGIFIHIVDDPFGRYLRFRHQIAEHVVAVLGPFADVCIHV